MRIFLILACGWGWMAASPLGAQPFETVEVLVGGATNVNRNFLHTFWTPGPGGEMVVALPFYAGQIEGGAALHRYEDKVPEVPRFDAVLGYLGWGVVVQGKGIRWYNGVRVGTYRMAFDEDTPFPGVRNESELTLGAQSRLQVLVTQRLSVQVAGSYMKTYTFLRLNLWHVSAGLGYRVRSPEWLKQVLR
jgi:hypothetical protein